MQRDDLIDLLGRIPEADHPKTQLILRTGMALSVDTYVRFEPTYVAVRGREAGQTEENRAFFVPYDEVVMLKIERMVKLSEMTRLYGEEPPAAPQPQPLAPDPIITPAPAVTPAPALDPAEIAKQNLLQRIRAARTMAGKSIPPK